MTALSDQIRERLAELADDGVDGTELEQATAAATEISALSDAVDAALRLAGDLRHEHPEPEYGTGVADQIEAAVAAALGITGPASETGEAT